MCHQVLVTRLPPRLKCRNAHTSRTSTEEQQSSEAEAMGHMKRKIIVLVIINMQKGDGHDEIQDLHGVNFFKVVCLKLRKDTIQPRYTNVPYTNLMN